MDVHARQWRQLAALSHPADVTPQFIDSIKALCSSFELQVVPNKAKGYAINNFALAS